MTRALIMLAAGGALIALWTYARTWRRRHPKRDYNAERGDKA